MEAECAVFLIRETWMCTLRMKSLSNSVNKVLTVVAPFVEGSLRKGGFREARRCRRFSSVIEAVTEGSRRIAISSKSESRKVRSCPFAAAQLPCV